MTLWIGTSGWQYGSWRGVLYPPELPQRRWLEHYAMCFRTVEVNTTFYRLPPASTFAAWYDRTPGDFLFSCKLSRFLTHVKRLRDPHGAVSQFLDRAAPLRDKLGPLLLQLPPTMQADPGRLAGVLEAVPRGQRVAVEFRHASWFTDEVLNVLREHDAALCLADRAGRVLGPVVRTASWGYVRLHEGRASPRPCYGRRALAGWSRRVAALWSRDDDVFVFFNNDPGGCAVRDAQAFARMGRRDGLWPTRALGGNELASPS